MYSEQDEFYPDEIIESSEAGINEIDLVSNIETIYIKIKDLSQDVDKAVSMAKASCNHAILLKEDGSFNNKVAIQDLQISIRALAIASIKQAKALETSYNFHKSLAELTSALFMLGVSNIASNRCVVRELEMRLKGASEEQISDLARQELQSIVKQLKGKEDILKKQEFMANKLKTHDNLLEVQKKIIKVQEIEIHTLKTEVENLKTLINSKGNNLFSKIVIIIVIIITIVNFFI